MELEYKECRECAAKPGSPILCPICIHNGNLVSMLNREIKLKDERAQKINEFIKAGEVLGVGFAKKLRKLISNL